MIILTSNLGAAIPPGPGLGFAPVGRVRAATVLEAIGQTFRPEFLNRLDRVVVFRPLGRELMRGLLKELNEVLSGAASGCAVGGRVGRGRGGLPDREGLQRRVGARPLKRAVERYLLTPLATAIVERQFPEGDQFLFITARDGPDSTSSSSTRTRAKRSRAAELPGGPGDLTLARRRTRAGGDRGRGRLPAQRARALVDASAPGRS